MNARFGVELVDADDSEALQRAIAAVREDGRTRFVRRGETVIATLEPPRRAHRTRSLRATQPRAPKRRRQGSFGMDDPIWRIVGIAGSVGPSDIAKYKDEYIAEALEEEFM